MDVTAESPGIPPARPGCPARWARHRTAPPA